MRSRTEKYPGYLCLLKKYLWQVLDNLLASLNLLPCLFGLPDSILPYDHAGQQTHELQRWSFS